MNTYFVMKWLHILSSVLMVGTGFGSAVYFFFVNRWGDIHAKQYVARMVVFCDWLFTTPTIILQPISGYWLMRQSGWTFDSPWFLSVLLVYVIVGMSWLPVVWLQIRMKQLLDEALKQNKPIPSLYETYRKWWEGLGVIGFGGSTVLFYLMVSKASFW